MLFQKKIETELRYSLVVEHVAPGSTPRAEGAGVLSLWHIPLVLALLALDVLRQENDCDFEASLSDIAM